MHTKVICIFRVKAGNEEAFEALLRVHWPALHALGLTTDEPPQHFRGSEGPAAPMYFEIFEWIDADAPGKAHTLPEVLAVWEPMGALVEDRDGKPKMQFPHVETFRP